LDPVPENEKSAMEGFCKRLEHSEVEGPIAKECGYIFSDVNCDLRLLHQLFGADIVGYLFDKTWIPIAKPVPTIYFPREFIPSDAKFGAKILFSISYSADEMETLTGVRSEPGSE